MPVRRKSGRRRGSCKRGARTRPMVAMIDLLKEFLLQNINSYKKGLKKVLEYFEERKMFTDEGVIISPVDYETAIHEFFRASENITITPSVLFYDNLEKYDGDDRYYNSECFYRNYTDNSSMLRYEIDCVLNLASYYRIHKIEQGSQVSVLKKQWLMVKEEHYLIVQRILMYTELLQRRKFLFQCIKNLFLPTFTTLSDQREFVDEINEIIEGYKSSGIIYETVYAFKQGITLDLSNLPVEVLREMENEYQRSSDNLFEFQHDANLQGHLSPTNLSFHEANYKSIEKINKIRHASMDTIFELLDKLNAPTERVLTLLVSPYRKNVDLSYFNS